MAYHANMDSEVDAWIGHLRVIDLDDTTKLEEVTSQIPSELVRPIGERGGSVIREKLLAPTFAEWERDGKIVWTGRVHRNGQKIWRRV